MKKPEKVPYLIHSFSVGERRSASGSVKMITPELIKELKETFDAKMRPAMVAGHFSDNPANAKNDGLPKFGTIRGVKVDKGYKNLYLLVDATAAGDKLIQEGYFDNFSIGIYPPGHPANPKPGKHVIRHLAMLGNSPPSIKDLDPALRLVPFDFSGDNEPGGGELLVYSEELMVYRSSNGRSRKNRGRVNTSIQRASGGDLRCTPGNKPCGGKCISRDQHCHVDENDETKPGVVLRLPNTPQISTAHVSKDRQFGRQMSGGGDRRPPFVPRFDRPQRKEKEFSDRLLDGAFNTMKVAGVIGGAFFAQHLVKKYAPNSPAAKVAAEAVVRIAAGQVFVSDDADVNTRVLNIAETMVPFAVEKTAERAGVDATVSKASTTLVSSIVFGKDAVFPTSYDSMQKKLMAESVKIGEIAGSRGTIKSKDRQRDTQLNDLNNRITGLENKYDTTVNAVSELKTEITSDVANLRSAQGATNARVARSNEQLTSTIKDLVDREQISRDAMKEMIELHKRYGHMSEEELNQEMSSFVTKLLAIQQRYYANEFGEPLNTPPAESELAFTGPQRAMIKVPLLYLLAFGLRGKDDSEAGTNFSEETDMATTTDVSLLADLVKLANQTLEEYGEDMEDDSDDDMPVPSKKKKKKGDGSSNRSGGQNKSDSDDDSDDDDDDDTYEDEGSDDDDDDDDDDDESMSMMKKKMDRMKKQKYDQYAEELYGEEGPLTLGIIDPTSLMNLFNVLDGEQDLHFAEDTGGSALDDFHHILMTLGRTLGSGLPKDVNYSMLDFSEGNVDPEAEYEFSEDFLQQEMAQYAEQYGLEPDHESVVNHVKALSIMGKNPTMSYIDALSSLIS